MKRSTLGIVFLIVFVDLLGFGIILPAFPFYVKSFGAGPTAYGLLLGGYSLMQFLFNPVWGRLSDRIGRRPVVLISVAGSAIGFLAFGLATSLAMLIAARLFAGVMNANIAAAQAAVADITPEDQRARSMGMIGAAFGLGFVFGPALGGLLSRFGLGVPALAAAGLSAVNFILAATLLPETNPGHRRRADVGISLQGWLKAVGRRDVGGLIVIFFISTFAYSVVTTALPYVLQEILHVDAAHVAAKTGLVFAFVGVIIALTQGAILRPLLRVVREGWLAVTGALLMLASLLLVPYAPTLTLLMAALSLLALGNGLSNPSLNSLISRRTAPADQGLVLGAAQSMNSLGRFLGPIVGGYSYDVWGKHAPFVTGSAFMGLAFLMSLGALRQVNVD